MSFKPNLVRSGLALAVFVACAPARAETAFTVNGVDVDDTVMDVYTETRLQKPAVQATADEKVALQEELTDIYLLTTQSRARELENDPKVQAELELQKRGTLAQAVAQDFLSRNQAAEDEILAEYARQIELAPPLQFKARHILVETQDAAVGLIAELDEGADFVELAQANSTGPSAPNGGDLGWFSPNQMVPPFSQAVSELEDGEYTEEPVQTEFGWHVILREDSRESEPPTLDSVRDVIKQRVEQQKLQQYIAQLRELDN